MVFTYNVARFFIEVESFEDGAKEIDVSLKVFDDHTPEGQLVAKISLDELLAQSGPRRYFTAEDWTPFANAIPLSDFSKILECLQEEGHINLPSVFKLNKEVA